MVAILAAIVFHRIKGGHPNLLRLGQNVIQTVGHLDDLL